MRKPAFTRHASLFIKYRFAVLMVLVLDGGQLETSSNSRLFAIPIRIGDVLNLLPLSCEGLCRFLSSSSRRCQIARDAIKTLHWPDARIRRIWSMGLGQRWHLGYGMVFDHGRASRFRGSWHVPRETRGQGRRGMTNVTYASIEVMEEIPEFSTVVLPVVATLLLAVFMTRIRFRKGAR